VNKLASFTSIFCENVIQEVKDSVVICYFLCNVVFVPGSTCPRNVGFIPDSLFPQAPTPTMEPTLPTIQRVSSFTEDKAAGV